MLIHPQGGDRLTNAGSDLLGEALRRAGEREGLVEALLDRGLQWDPLLERNRLLEAVAEAALAYRRATEGRQDTREAGAASTWRWAGCIRRPTRGGPG